MVEKFTIGEALDAYDKVAQTYAEQGFFLKSVAVYKQILKLDPRLVEVNLKLAELYRQLGLLSDAMQHFEMVAAHFHREGKTKEALDGAIAEARTALRGAPVPDLTARVIAAYDVPTIWTRPDDPARSEALVATARRTLDRLGPEGAGRGRWLPGR